MIELWADLLSAASTNPAVPPRFASIIAEMDSTQAKLLHYIANEKNDELVPGAQGYAWRQKQSVQNYIEELLHNAEGEITADKLASELMMFEFRSNGTYLAALVVSESSPHSVVNFRGEPGIEIEDIPYKNLEVLKSLGLLERIEIIEMWKEAASNAFWSSITT
jgi:hypothetical protein